ncbi:MAG: type II toxin-antitoxin system RelE/ParE family toxin [Nitrospirae bacterium]|nr:MAG: type II toxin-antitoxin system RelE/ParE family toxin [Nitrospirota bacterium]
MWTIEYDTRAEEWLCSLQPDIKARILRIIDMMLALGPMNIHEPYVKHIEGYKKLFEIRARGKDSIVRAFYFTMTEQRIVILHGFTKKTPKTPKSEIEIALKRMQEVLNGKT